MTLTALWGHLRRMLAVAHVEVLHLVWDPTTVSLILLVPAIQIVLFGYAINLDPKHVPIAIAGDYDRKAEKVRATIERTGYFMIVADGQGRSSGSNCHREIIPMGTSYRANPGSSWTLSIHRVCVQLWPRSRMRIGNR